MREDDRLSVDNTRAQVMSVVAQVPAWCTGGHHKMELHKTTASTLVYSAS